MNRKLTLCRVGTELQQAINAADMLPTSVHLGKLSDSAIQILHESLIYEHDAHRAHVFGSGQRTDSEMREYFAAVKLELLTRTSAPPQFAGEVRYKTVTPVDKLRRAIDSTATQGTVSLGDLQAEYRRIRR